MIEQRDVLLGLHELPGIGWMTIYRLKETFKDLREIRRIDARTMSNAAGIEPAKAALIQQRLTPEWIEERKAACRRFGLQILTIFDREYPYLLRKIPEKPWVLYAKGRIELLHRNAISIVGTRTPTVYGRRAAETVSRDLSREGVTVVSGMARGIDRYAHEGALAEEGSTIAVMATGFDRIYPAEHLQLYRAICERGVVLTETPLQQHAVKGLFPKRNRIIAGLSWATVVIEAAEKSGSLITADQAVDYNREVFGLPGSIFSEQSRGVLSRFVYGGAIPFQSAHDIIWHLGLVTSASGRSPEASIGPMDALSDDERQVLACLSHEPIAADEILTKCKFSFGHLHAVLLSLLMKKKIDQLPGSKYISLN